MKFLKLLGMVILALIFSSCANNDRGNQTQSNVLGDEALVDTAANVETFFGSWEIDSVAAYGRVSALEDDAINELIGKRILYSSHIIKFDDEVILEDPVYKKTSLSENDFFTLNYVDFEDIHFSGDQVELVEVYTIGDEAWYSTNQQGSFVVINKDRLLLIVEGVYFNLRRI